MKRKPSGDTTHLDGMEDYVASRKFEIWSEFFAGLGIFSLALSAVFYFGARQDSEPAGTFVTCQGTSAVYQQQYAQVSVANDPRCAPSAPDQNGVVWVPDPNAKVTCSGCGSDWVVVRKPINESIPVPTASQK